jgi:hypothetical protein
MEFNVRLLQEGDYENTLKGWWDDWNWTAPPKESLPNNGLGGFMVSKGDVDICAGFAYFTNSNLAWCEFVVSNKTYKEEDRNDAIEMLINNIVEASKNAGYKAIFTSVSNENLINKYQNCGFVKTQEGATEMIKFL